MRALALLATLAGCYSPAYDNCAISCTPAVGCPAGYDCVGGRCQVPGQACTGGDGGMLFDADVSGWQFRKQVTFAAPEGSATDYPLLVRVRDPDLASFAQDEGGDIRFTTTDLLALPHEIEAFDESNGALVAWVKVPRIVAGAATEIYMYYGNANAPDQQQRAAVWSGHVAVWHLSDPPGTTIADATGAHPGQKAQPNTPSPSTGLIAGAHAFNGTTSDHFAVTSSASFDSTVMTFETWLNAASPAVATVHRLLTTPASLPPHSLLYDDPSQSFPGGQFIIGALDMTGGPGYSTSMGVLPNQWQHLMVVWNPSGAMPVLVYMNGAPLPASPFVAGNTSDVVSLFIGGVPAANQPGPLGMLDEVRISTAARSLDWAKLSYQLGAGSSTPPLTLGPAETL